MNHPVWIDEAGQITTPPKNALHRGMQTALAGACIATATSSSPVVPTPSTSSGRRWLPSGNVGTCDSRGR
jgi:hypothetical protein